MGHYTASMLRCRMEARGSRMIALYTDFGPLGPYVGQVKTVLSREAPGVPVIDLLHDAPRFNPRAAAYLLCALAAEFPAGSILVCVVVGAAVSLQPECD